LRSRVVFNAIRGTRYLIAVDGVNGAQGNINLNWKFGVAAPPAGKPVYKLVLEGSAVELSAGNVVTPAPAYQWRLNGSPISGATNRLFNLSKIEFGQHGVYSVVIRGAAGAVTNQIAQLVVHVPLRLEQDYSLGPRNFRLKGSATNAVILDLSTNLSTWRAIFTNENPDVQVNFLDSTTSQRPRSFYRLRARP
jgi:hypothetical protein